MQQWEYCEVGWTPKQVTIHVYSSSADGTYEGVQTPEEWGALLSQLGADGWELVGVVPTKPITHSLYYFKRPISSSERVIGLSDSSEREKTWEELNPEERMVKMKEEIAKRKQQLAEQKKP
jgi:hypothetical protein